MVMPLLIKQLKNLVNDREYLVNWPNLKEYLCLLMQDKLTENDEIMYNYLKHYNIDVTIVNKHDK